jgi:hypothetical protein
MKDVPNEETYSEEETERRPAAALKRMLQTPQTVRVGSQTA